MSVFGPDELTGPERAGAGHDARRALPGLPRLSKVTPAVAGSLKHPPPHAPEMPRRSQRREHRQRLHPIPLAAFPPDALQVIHHRHHRPGFADAAPFLDLGSFDGLQELVAFIAARVIERLAELRLGALTTFCEANPVFVGISRTIALVILAVVALLMLLHVDRVGGVPDAISIPHSSHRHGLSSVTVDCSVIDGYQSLSLLKHITYVSKIEIL